MKQYLLTSLRKQKYAVAIGDIIVFSLAIISSYLIRAYINHQFPVIQTAISRISGWQVLVVMCHVFMLYLFDLYDSNRIESPTRNLLIMVTSVFTAGFLISGILFFVPKYVFGRQVLLIHLIVVSLFIYLWRLLAARVLMRSSAPERIALVGDTEVVNEFAAELSRFSHSGFEIASVCVSDPTTPLTSTFPESVTFYDGITAMLEEGEFDALVFDSAKGVFSEEETRRILQLRFIGKAVYDLPTLYENLTGKVPLAYIDGRWLMESNGLLGRPDITYVKVKRVIDCVVSFLLLFAAVPVCFVVALAVRTESKGSVFFVQERIGLNRRPFRCYKFRTMVEDAEAESGPVWAGEDDPRVTKVGNILRKTRLDELPQLYNVLKGEMSFVGPRPIRRHFAEQLDRQIPFYGLRFAVKPGLTGWAQVNCDYGGSFEGQLEKFQHDLFYIRNMSLFLDLITMFKTIKTVVDGTGQ